MDYLDDWALTIEEIEGLTSNPIFLDGEPQ
jgi:hypothetical protein